MVVNRKYIILAGLTITLATSSLLPIFLTLDSWIFSPQFSSSKDWLNDLSMSKNGDYIIAAGWNFYLISKFSHSPIWTFAPEDPIQMRKCAISSDGEKIVLGYLGSVLLFNRINSIPLWEYYVGDPLDSIDISDDGTHFIICAIEKGLYLFESANSIPLWIYSEGQEFAEFASNGNYIITGISNTLSFFSVNSSTPLWQYNLTSDIAALSINNNGDKILAGCQNGNIYFFNNYNSTPAWSYSTSSLITDVGMCSDGENLVVSDDNEILYFFNNSTPIPIWTYELIPDYDWSSKSRVSISGDGNYIIFTKNKHLRYFNTLNSEPIWEEDVDLGYDSLVPKPVISDNGIYFAMILAGELFFYNRYNTHLSGDFEAYYFWLFSIGYPGVGIYIVILIRNLQKERRKSKQIKDIIKNMDKIKLEMILDILDMNKNSDEFLSLVEEYGLKVENDYVIIDSDRISEFIEGLSNKFKEWERMKKKD